MKPALALLTLSLLATGCANREQFREIGREPSLSPVGSGLAPTGVSDYSYPSPPTQPVKKFSLWNDRQSRLFTDPRALAPGDILTVKIAINDRARFKNESERARDASRTLGGSAEAGWNSVSTGVASLDVGVNSKTATKGTGATARSEAIDLQVAAVVTEVLPNGNLAIRGTQEVRVNAELRVLTIEGIVRPSDIGAENTISYDRIAEARISYGGRGRITEVQQPPYGQQVVDLLSPF
ncbi:MAG: flagellar basal body L-ring protein [Mesorhizobium amorphae]|nr:MAG: flagellar basal body L-ring protein [Mesorhizobium amorphae]